MNDRLTRNLIAKGVEFSVAEDKAMMSDDTARQNHFAGALEGITVALALHLGASEGTALEMILTATGESGQ